MTRWIGNHLCRSSAELLKSGRTPSLSVQEIFRAFMSVWGGIDVDASTLMLL